MKIIKNIFLLLLVILVAGAIYLATLDGRYDVKRSRVIKANSEVIFNDLNDYKNWAAWGPWYEMDSTIVATYSENTIGEGASYTWSSSKDGDGEMRTISVDKPNKLNQEIIFKTPFGEMKSNIYWRLEKAEEGTKVTWGMKGEMGFFSRFMAKGMEDQMGPMQERGLELLDESIQKKLDVYSIESKGVVDYSGGFYLYNTVSCRIDEVGTRFPTLLMKVLTFVRTNKIRTTGGAFSLYHKYDVENGTTMFSVCYPIAERVITLKGSDVLTGFMKRGKYYKTTLKGSYNNSQKAWEKAIIDVENLLDYSELENGEPFEVFVNSPHKTPNPADLITEIYIPVEKVNVNEETSPNIEGKQEK